MSDPLREDRCELQPVTCWPLIYGAASVVALGVLVGLGLLVADSMRPRPSVAEAPAAPKPREVEQPAVPIDRGPDVPAPVVEQEPPSKAKRVYVVREYVPLPPVKAKQEEEWPVTVRLTRKSGKEGKSVQVSSVSLARDRPPTLDEKTLSAALWKQSREVDLETEKGAGKQLLEVGKKHVAEVGKNLDKKPAPSFSSPLEKLLAARDDLRGLPLLAGKACQTDKEQAKVLGTVSLKVRPLQARSERRIEREMERSRSLYEEDKPEVVDPSLKRYLAGSLKEVKDARLLVGPLEQMYQIETAGLRAELVATLGKVKGKEATQAIARRAVFDLSPKARAAAVAELRGRDAEDAREVFLAALRHPWAPAANHAALALVELKDEDALPELKKLALQPDPSSPVKGKDGKWRSKELVRVNHLRNCLLCHAPSIDDKDVVRGPIPTPGEPLPIVYYEDRSRSRSPLVRADVVYFRQDFSAMHKVKDPNKWPEIQRFDYLVQARELSAEEAEKTRKKLSEALTYPQRMAIQWAVASLEQIERVEPRK